MKDQFKRFLSLVLAIVMVIGMMPTNTVYAEGETEMPDSGEQVAATTEPTTEPEEQPTEPPTEPPTTPPTEPPTETPTAAPTEPPTEAPTAAPTEPPTETPTAAPTEAPTAPPTEAPTEETEPVCTGLADCAAENHADTCEKKIAEEKAAADKAAADAVAAQIEVLPTLEQLRAMPFEEQAPYYNQVQSVYGAYEKLSADQKALLPPAEEVFKPYFDYFNSLTDDMDLIDEGTCGDNLTWTLDAEGTLTISGTGRMNDWNHDVSATPWYQYQKEIKKVVVGDGVTYLGNCAFYKCEAMTSVELPDTLTEIGESAFVHCSMLQWPAIPQSVEVIGPCAFYACQSLECIELSDNVKQLGYGAFAYANLSEGIILSENLSIINWSTFLNCQIGQITIPANVKKIENEAFYGSSVNQITFVGDAPQFTYIDEAGNEVCSDEIFCNVTATAYYPAGNDTWTEGVRQNYGGDITWVSVANEGKCGENITWTFNEATGKLTISGSGAMYDQEVYGGWNFADSIKEVAFEGNITHISDYAFLSCENLKRVTLPNSLVSIGLNAFERCWALTDIALPENLSSIGEWAFSDCVNLESIVIPKGITTLNDGVFSSCKKLVNITLPDGITDIGLGVFSGCTSLTSITIPKNVTGISEYMFADCDSLTSMVIPKNIKTIDYYAFSSSGLNEIIFEGDAPEIKVDAFTDLTATAYYPIGKASWTEEVRQSYGGNIAWKAVGTTATNLRLTTSSSTVTTKNEFCVQCNEVPDNATSALTWTVSDNLEIIHASSAYCDLRAKSTGTGTVTVTDSLSGLTRSITVDIVQPKWISCGYSETLDITPYGETKYYTFTPQKTQEYVFTLGNLDSVDSYELISGVTICARNISKDEQLSRQLMVSTDTTKYIYELEAGTEYLIWLENYHNITDNIVFRLDEAAPISGIDIANEEIVVEFPGNWNGSDGQLVANVYPDNAAGMITWSCSDPEILDFTDYYYNNSCWYEAKKEGTVVVTASYGGYSDSVTVIIQAEPTLELYKTYRESCGTRGIKSFKFTAPEDGTYLFDVESDRVLDVYIAEHTPSYNGDVIAEMSAGETCVVQVREEYLSGTPADFTITVRKVVQPESMQLDVGMNNASSVVLSAVFSPANAYDEVTTWTSSNDAVLKIRDYQWGPNIVADIQNTGEVTITATTESGLSASRTVMVGFCGNNQSWMLDESGTLEIYGTGAMDSYKNRIEEVPWHGVKDRIRKVVISEGVTSIGDWAFLGYENLQSVTFPKTLETIGEESFSACYNLKSLNLPSKLVSIGREAFASCIGLKTVVIPDSVELIDGGAFLHCDNLTSVSIGKNVRTIGENAFSYNGNLTQVKLGENVTAIGVDAFGCCGKLTEITIPARVTEIGAYAFEHDENLKKITFEGNAPKIGARAFGEVEATAYYFAGDKTWTEAVKQNYGGTITWEGYNVASGVCGDNLTWTFDAATATLTISGTGRMYDYDLNTTPWYHIRNIIQKVTIEEGTTYVGNYAFCAEETLSEVHLPNTLKEIGKCAFAGFNKLESITIPNGVISIDEMAFFDCRELRSIKIPDSVTFLGEMAFNQCYSLTEVTLGKGISALEGGIFVACSFKEIVIPANIKSIGPDEFGIDELSRIVFLGDHPEISDGAFFGVTATAYYPFGNPTWTSKVLKDYGGEITWIPYSGTEGKCGKNVTWRFDETTGTLTLSGTGEMYNYTETSIPNIPWAVFADKVQKLVVEEGVTSIGDFAFNNCKNISQLNLPLSMKRLGDMAFYGNEGIVDLVLPEGLVQLGDGVFEWSTELKSVVIPSSVDSTYMGATFWCCQKLESAVAGNLTPCMFAFCPNLKKVVLGDSITTIPVEAFLDCSLPEIVIPDSVESIESNAFSCYKLGQITFLGDAPAFAADAFEGVTTTAYYPFGNPTWTAAVMKDYGGDITWIPYEGTEGKCGENLIWRFDDETGTLTISGTGEMTNYSEPSLENIPWAPFASRVQKLVVEEGVTSIGEWAFIKCLNYKELVLPNTLESIGGYSFYGNEVIEELILPEGLKYIGEAAFEYCTNLTKIVIPESLESSGYAPFWCTNPETVVAGNLTPGLFAYCHSYQVVLGETITTIPEQAFVDDGLGEIVIPASVNTIEKQAFYLCGKGNKIVFQGNAPQIAENAFEGTTATIYYPAGNETWTEEVRQNYGGTITWVALAREGKCGQNLTWKFDDATGTLTISGTGRMYDFDYEPTAMPWYPLQKEIKKIVVEEGVTGLGQCAFYQSEAATEVSLPSTLVVIGESAFEFCEALEAVTIPDSVEIIGGAAFYMCKSLKSMKLSNNVTSLGGGAFWGCCSMTEIILSKNIDAIGAETFADCTSLHQIVIPESIKSIGDSAFLVSGLNTITFMGDAPQIAANAFVDLKVNAIYPAGNATWTEAVRQNYGGTVTWLAEGMDGNDITLEHSEWADVSTVWVNGVAYPVVTEDGQTKIQIPDDVEIEEGTSMVTYNFHVGDAGDVHTQYPTGMQVWILQENELGELVPVRVEELDNILQYSGSSIRITGKRGIRMITSIEQSKKNALVSAGLAEYKLMEYGTALCWARDLSGGTDLTLGQSYVKSNYAYKRGVADPVFKYAGSLMQYTNVLVGFSMDECKDDIAMRPYMILEGPNGEQVTIYGGIVYRSIGYIAYQNRNAFTVGSDAYNYVWDIIHHVYGNKYDADYKG